VKATINNHDYQIEQKENSDSFTLNGKDFEINSVNISEGIFHILHNSKSYTAELIETDESAKLLTVRVNGNTYRIAIEDKYDALLHQLGMDKLLTPKVNDLKAPMPGMVLDVLVTEGQVIKKGDNLVVLEAMKMENNLKAQHDAKVKKVKVSKGTRVEKNEVLIELNKHIKKHE
jgi:acetyl/propionyl-CoA carboxylase alpha subunit